ncbi:MAG: hypothetical protein ACKVH8_15975 [Pirellulales bacterium]
MSKKSKHYRCEVCGKTMTLSYSELEELELPSQCTSCEAPLDEHDEVAKMRHRIDPNSLRPRV